VKAGRFPILGDGGGVFSFIHVRDAARATFQALKSRTTGVFNIVDDTPVAVSEWLPWYADRLGARPPMTMPEWLGGLFAGRYARYMMIAQPGAGNGKAIRELGRRPAF